MQYYWLLVSKLYCSTHGEDRVYNNNNNICLLKIDKPQFKHRNAKSSSYTYIVQT